MTALSAVAIKLEKDKLKYEALASIATYHMYLLKPIWGSYLPVRPAKKPWFPQTPFSWNNISMELCFPKKCVYLNTKYHDLQEKFKKKRMKKKCPVSLI